MRATLLRVLTVLTLAAVAGWSLSEIFASGNLVAVAILLPAWIGGVTGALVAPRRDRLAWERGSRVAIGFVFFANRIVLLGPDVVAMSAFVAVLLVLAIVQRFDRMFGPVYQAARGETAPLREMDRALVLSLARALGAVGLSLALTLIAANAIVVGFLPFTSPLTALVLALLFIGVIVRLARAPVPRRREAAPPGAGNL